MLGGFCELTLGNVVVVWSFFVDGDGARGGLAALTDGGGAPPV